MTDVCGHAGLPVRKHPDGSLILTVGEVWLLFFKIKINLATFFSSLVSFISNIQFWLGIANINPKIYFEDKPKNVSVGILV